MYVLNKFNLPNLYNCSVAVIGLGYVGLTLALEIAKNKKYSIIIIALKHKEFNYLKYRDIKELSFQYSIIFDITNNYFGKNIKHL